MVHHRTSYIPVLHRTRSQENNVPLRDVENGDNVGVLVDRLVLDRTGNQLRKARCTAVQRGNTPKIIIQFDSIKIIMLDIDDSIYCACSSMFPIPIPHGLMTKSVYSDPLGIYIVQRKACTIMKAAL